MRKEYHRNAEEKSTERSQLSGNLTVGIDLGTEVRVNLHFEPGGRGRRGHAVATTKKDLRPRLRTLRPSPPGVGGGDALAVGDRHLKAMGHEVIVANRGARG